MSKKSELNLVDGPVQVFLSKPTRVMLQDLSKKTGWSKPQVLRVATVLMHDNFEKMTMGDLSELLARAIGGPEDGK